MTMTIAMFCGAPSDYRHIKHDLWVVCMLLGARNLLLTLGSNISVALLDSVEDALPQLHFNVRAA